MLGSGPSEWFAHSHVPVATTEDLKGAKYRTLGNWAAVVESGFGAAPTTVPGTGVYSMLEKKGIEAAKLVGLALAKLCKEKNINQVIFDRNGFLYHGRVKAVADGAREGGLEF